MNSVFEILFAISLTFILYTYLGYPLFLFFLVKMKRLIRGKVQILSGELPSMTLIVACYNEKDILGEKVENTLALKYPEGKLEIIFVTDGSDDGSEVFLAQFPQIKVFHSPERKGKNAAINRVMPEVRSEVVTFCDANTTLNEEALLLLGRHFLDEKVGAVAGEKRVKAKAGDGAASSGEGAYWKYESQLKKWDSELYTVVGAAGELFSVRTSLYETVPEGIIIEDFYISLSIAQKGYLVRYEPDAYAEESGSASMEEERKRKVRIAAGGLQAVWLLRSLFNVFRYGWLSFQFTSHRAFRWTVAPLALLIVFVSNVYLAVVGGIVFQILLAGQLFFYLLAFAGHLQRDQATKTKIFLLPYYFTFMHLSVFQGAWRLIKGSQSAVWEKAKRAG
jgi:poly-beta-1,6-N-acetyl-D-glucosamine synthase